MTFGDLLRKAAESAPNRLALIAGVPDPTQRRQWTYAELYRQAQRTARALSTRFKKGERIAVWAQNLPEWVMLEFGAGMAGMVLVTVNPAFRANEVQYVLKQSRSAGVFVVNNFRGNPMLETVQAVKANCPELREIICFDDWDAFIAAGDDESIKLPAVSPDDPVMIQYTSGTTGFPKGATLSHHNVLNNGFFVGEALRYTAADRVCIPVPFYHCFGMVMGNLACTSHGATMVIPGEAFDPLAVLETVQAERCTSLYGVPTMFIAALDHARFHDFDLSSLRTGIMAGSPCPIEVMKQVVARMHMPEVTICYGMTETSPVSTQSALDDALDRRVGTVGRVHPHVEVKVVDPATGGVVSPGAPGELCTRGYSVMLGYWNNPEATRAALDDAGWMHTGDMATMDEHGYVKIVGRIKDMIIRGGENIYPREVEEFLHRHPGVSEAQVIGVPSARYGEEVMAWVRLKPGASVTEEDLVAHCTGQIATYKIPRYWKLVDEFPMTVTGKVQKFRMREIAIDDLGLGQAARAPTA
ncbi:MAG TPA: AMP-binding protein [Haliangium sp.]|nr:AMP-binding protein [Haliangium sp.]